MADTHIQDADGELDVAKKRQDLLSAPFQRLLGSLQRKKETRNRKSKSTAELAQQSLFGPWKYLAYTTETPPRPRVPVLETESFQLYLEKEGGLFTPEGPCLSTANWTKFVHAFNITPSTRVSHGGDKTRPVLGFRDLNEREGSLSAEKVRLEISGKVLCHIVNLFEDQQITDDPVEFKITQLDKGKANLRFAVIAYDMTDPDRQGVACEYQGHDELGNNRVPFGKTMYQGLRSLPNVSSPIREPYKQAIKGPHGCSDPILKWTLPGATLKERIQNLDANFLAVRERTSPLLLTFEWLELANRVRRRATTNGGKDRIFQDRIYAAIEKGDWFRSRDWCLREASEAVQLQRKREVVEELKKKVSPLFFFEGDSFHYSVSKPDVRGYLVGERGLWSEAREEKLRNEIVDDILTTVLQSFKDEQILWLQELYDAREEVFKLMKRERAVWCNGLMVRILRFRPESKLWDKTFRI